MDHRNKTTGQCNPRESSLAEELGISRQTVLRGLKELRRAGWIQAKRGQNGNRYEFPEYQNGTSQVASCYLGSRASLYEPYLKKSAACGRATPQKKSAQREEVLARYYAKQRKAGS
jgi:DNA-binding transcriptional MocR family regulator